MSVRVRRLRLLDMVLAMEARECPNTQVKAGRLIAEMGHYVVPVCLMGHTAVQTSVAQTLGSVLRVSSLIPVGCQRCHFRLNDPGADGRRHALSRKCAS